jgi:hypothetical protein
VKALLEELWQEGVKEFIWAGETQAKYLPDLVVDVANASCWLYVSHYTDQVRGGGKHLACVGEGDRGRLGHIGELTQLKGFKHTRWGARGGGGG